MTLKDLSIGKTATVCSVGGEGALRQHFLDMGLIPTADVTMVKYAPMGDPVEVRIHSYELTLRLDDAAQITVTHGVSCQTFTSSTEILAMVGSASHWTGSTPKKLRK